MFEDLLASLRGGNATPQSQQPPMFKGLFGQGVEDQSANLNPTDINRSGSEFKSRLDLAQNPLNTMNQNHADNKKIYHPLGILANGLNQLNSQQRLQQLFDQMKGVNQFRGGNTAALLPPQGNTAVNQPIAPQGNMAVNQPIQPHGGGGVNMMIPPPPPGY